MQIKFCGAAREVTGSAHLITLDDGSSLLLDCGLYQGRNSEMEEFNGKFPFEPQELSAVLLSHAHIDHCGRLPKLVKDGFKGRIYATHATRSLCALLLADSAHIQEMDADYYNKKHPEAPQRLPLYSAADVKATLERFVGLPYDEWFTIQPDLAVQYRDAGHILGSASVTLRVQRTGQTAPFFVGFTGDIGRPNRPILRDPQPLPPCDVIISESTYGDRSHDSPPNELTKFLAIIQQTCVAQGGKLLIPAFSVGRTQEIVHLLDQLESAGRLPKIPVYVDSPLAVNATTVFGAHPECYDEEMKNFLLMDSTPFGFKNLHYVQEVAASKALNQLQGPAIIISASGMMNAGRSKHHLRNTIGNENNTIFIVGYCSPETPGGKLRAGAKGLKLFGEYHELKASVVVMDSFSAHADQGEMLALLANQQKQCKQLFLVHSTLERQEIFRTALLAAGFTNVQIPALYEEVNI
ncbi:MAG: MBL fold metallo-hydrolase [Lewinella sp.]|nr:MBL fold metallo-hydrolase [Lewinella sp.]